MIEKGAQFASIEEIGTQSDIVFTMLGYPKDLEEVVLNPDSGLFKFMKSGSILIDHTTSSPDLAERISEAGKSKGIGCIDAPVSGGDIGAKNGQVVSMCGGEKDIFEKAEPLMAHYSKKVKLMGGPG